MAAVRVPDGLHVEVHGSGPEAIFVHGSMGWGEDTFPRQRELAAVGYTVVLVDRRGFGGSPPLGPVDFERDADDLGELAAGGAHLVGHSYGAVVAMLAAQADPGAVLSLTLIEPPLLGAAESDASVSEWRDRLAELYAAAPSLTHEEFWLGFVSAGGVVVEDAPRLNELDRRAIEATMTERPIWGARVAFETLRAMSCPKVLCLGGRRLLPGPMTLSGRALHVVGAEVAERIGAEVAFFEFSAHNPQLEEPVAFNKGLLQTWSRDRARPPVGTQ
jgi:pimeloyl-ACP methyl ester carboxylesterase